MRIQLHAREVGSGIPLVLLHAFPLSSAMWLEQREGLSDVARVITPDQRGFGGSPLGDDLPDLDEAADDVAALLDRLQLSRVVLAGLSMGGYVAMAFASRHAGRLLGLVLADTKASADPPPARERRERIAAALLADADSTVLVEEVLPSLLGTTTKERRALVLGRVKALVQAAPPAAAAWANRAMAARRDSFDTLGRLDLPTLVVVGEEDELSPPADAEAMVAALPQGRLVRLPAAGHLSAVEVPAEFNAAVRDFLAAL